MKFKKIFPSLNIDTYWILGFPLLFLITLVFFFKFNIGDNEIDVIPYAKSIYSGDWLKNDWYLNLKILHRYFFSYPVGFFVKNFGFIETIFVGRIISYILIAISLNVLIKSVKSKSYSFLFYFAIILFYRFFPYGIGAGEWLVGGFESKVFAYGFAILSLSSFLHKQHQKGLLFAGLSLSIHLLVGIYNLFCLLPILIFYQRESKDFIFKIFKSLPIFLFAGSIGFIAIIYQFFFIEEDITNLGWNIYVNVRVPHHTLPLFFPFKAWIIFPIFVLCNLGLFLKSKKQEVKLMSSYALFSAIISLFGLAIFFLPVSNIHLKYYFFRFSDIMLPLITLLNITSYIIENRENTFSKRNYRLKYILAAIAFLIMIPKINYFLSEVDTSFQQIKANTSNDNVMVNWVRNNTDTKKVFITHPDDKFFYINYERPMFVGWKHIPSGAKDIVEWYNRLKLLNRSQDFKSIKEIKQNYLNLTEKEIIAISEEYPNVSYVLMPKSIKLNFPTLFKSSRYILYEIRNIAN
jgi:Domain of unknown function (DUF6798)